MGKIDTVTNQYISHNAVFADAVNNTLHRGQPVVRPEELKPLDPTVYWPGSRTRKGKKRTTDVTKMFTAKEDSSNIYLIISAENQSISSLTMPVRVLQADAMRYSDQIRQKTAEYERRSREGSFRWNSPVEMLSGIQYGDLLKPVITIVIHWEGTPWEGPRSLHEMLSFEQDWMRKCVPDWPLFLLDAADYKNVEAGHFQSDLGDVLHLIQTSSDRESLEDIREGNDELIALTSDAKQVIKEITGLKKYQRKEKKQR